MQGFDTLQASLNRAVALNRPGQTWPHVVVVLPSLSLGEAVLAHYGSRLPALEHRYLAAFFMLHRLPNCEVIYVSTLAPSEEVMEYCASLLPPGSDALARFHCFALGDTSMRGVAEKLLDRPDVIAAIRDRIGGRPAFLEPWNVTEAEARLALELGVPVNGSDPGLWPLGFKGAGRRLMREAGVPLPAGREELVGVEDTLDAILSMRAEDPALRRVIIKHDDSAAGDGNRVVDLSDSPTDDALRGRLEAFGPAYWEEMAKGGIVEEMVAGERFTSPSVQVDILPDGVVEVLATHEQELGGEDGQVYVGCRFPADPAYAPELAQHGWRVGEALAKAGALGRFALDFAAVESGGEWRVVALEINLRKGGTTHPYACLRNLVPGRYDEEAGVWQADAGGTRAYVANDNVMDPAWVGLPPAEVIGRVREAGLQFDPVQGTGVVLLMLSGLSIDGRFAAVAIGRDEAEAQRLKDAVPRALGAS
ncbi:carboxylate-amine ligase [Rubellimicrobium rubrum]|uniref:Carboxylate-amine ligase n=1 Tax=Rubellimicrobium rubrum TaxID=2585369 RepID=A0A5C4MUY1_9RHOB|nr:peptide ligase PGM1-related protein [Rubellimicrobium rubrum]TNC48282.1 carboxylate-amine ligase [Rubellimicrobium rubrum]